MRTTINTSRVHFEQHYRFVAELGDGGSATIDLYQTLEEKPWHVSIKEIDKERIKNPHVLELVEHEAEMLRRFRHPNIVKVEAIFVDTIASMAVETL